MHLVFSVECDLVLTEGVKVKKDFESSVKQET